MPYGCMDRHDEANVRFSQFRERALKQLPRLHKYLSVNINKVDDQLEATVSKCEEREKPNKMQQLDVYYQLLS